MARTSRLMRRMSSGASTLLAEDRGAREVCKRCETSGIPTGDEGRGRLTFAPTGVTASQHANERASWLPSPMSRTCGWKGKKINSFDFHLTGRE